MDKKTLKVQCFITGDEQVFSGEYLENLIKKYGSKENILKYYISFKAKNFLLKGYSIDEIRNILVHKKKDLKDSSSEKAKEIVKYWTEKNNKSFKRNNEVSFIKTDSEVKNFIDNWKNYRLSKNDKY